MIRSQYSTKLVQRSTAILLPLAILFILFGIGTIILSSIDLHHSRSILNGTNVIFNSASSRTEQSIWPTLGKGIWVGLFFIAIGILSIISHREKTLISVRILCLLSFISLFLSIYLFLSSILVFQRYIVEGRLNANQRNFDEQQELVLNSLLLVFGVLAFLTSLILSFATLVIGNFCQRKSSDEDGQSDDLMEKFSPRMAPPPAYSASAYYR